jgi:hypothetical protein
VDFFATGGKEGDHFRSNQARGAGYEKLHACYLCGRWDGEGKGIFQDRILGVKAPRLRDPACAGDF